MSKPDLKVHFSLGEVVTTLLELADDQGRIPEEFEDRYQKLRDGGTADGACVTLEQVAEDCLALGITFKEKKRPSPTF